MASAGALSSGEGLDVMPRMQLAALSMNAWLDTSKCCFCIPLVSGGVLSALLLVLRGSYLVSEGFDTVNLLLEPHFKWGPPRVLLASAGFGDLLCAFVLLLGLMQKRAELVMWLFLWSTASLVLLLATLGSVIPLGAEICAGVKTDWEVIDMALFAAVTLLLPLAGLRLLLSVTLRWTLAPSMLQLVAEAQRVAYARADFSCDKRHLLAVLLQDQGFQTVLQVGNADIGRMMAELTTERDTLVPPRTDDDDEEQRPSHPDHEPQSVLDTLPLGLDAEELIRDAARVQWSTCADRLRAEHLVMALCQHDEIVVSTSQGEEQFAHTSLASFRVNARAVREHLDEFRKRMDEAHVPTGPPGAPLFGFLPLEETVLVYTIVHVIVNAGSVFGILLYGKGLGTLVGLRTIPLMNWLELIASGVGAPVGAVAVASILSHRATRCDIRKAAYSIDGQWDTDLRSTFEKVRGEPRAGSWRNRLFKAANLFGLFTLWMPMQCLAAVPIILMYLADSNTCGVYWNGISWASNPRAIPQPHYTAPLHCTDWDEVFLGALLLWGLFETYMVWGVMALWHEYAYGWTTTDLRGGAYIEPSPMPEALARKLAGVSRSAVRRGRPANVPATEATPLLL